MSKQERLRRRIDALRAPFEQLVELLSQLHQARALTSDVTEQLRLDASIKSKQAQRDSIEAELDRLEAELAALSAGPQAAAPLLFWSYAHDDEPLRDELARRVEELVPAGRARFFHDRQVTPGQPMDTTAALGLARVIVLLLSPDYLAGSERLQQMDLALRRREHEQVTVLPIILRPCVWDATPVAGLSVLPKDGVPVVNWPDRQMILRELARQIAAALPSG